MRSLARGENGLQVQVRSSNGFVCDSIWFIWSAILRGARDCRSPATGLLPLSQRERLVPRGASASVGLRHHKNEPRCQPFSYLKCPVSGAVVDDDLFSDLRSAQYRWTVLPSIVRRCRQV